MKCLTASFGWAVGTRSKCCVLSTYILLAEEDSVRIFVLSLDMIPVDVVPRVSADCSVEGF